LRLVDPGNIVRAGDASIRQRRSGPVRCAHEHSWRDVCAWLATTAMSDGASLAETGGRGGNRGRSGGRPQRGRAPRARYASDARRDDSGSAGPKSKTPGS
jgi:hypothetical protein